MKLTDLRGILQYIPQFREKTFILAIDAGIVVDTDGKCRFNGAFPDAFVVGELANAWASHRARVIETVFSKPADNVRIFADAFVIGADKKGRNDG